MNLPPPSIPSRGLPAALLRSALTVTVAAAITFALFVALAALIAPRAGRIISCPPGPRFVGRPDPAPRIGCGWCCPHLVAFRRPEYRVHFDRMETAGLLQDELHSEVGSPVPGPLELGDSFMCLRVVGSEPEYPASARRRRIDGQVVLDLAVDPTGAVSDASVLRSEPAGVFDATALRAVRRWRYQGSGCTRTQVRLRFELPAGAR